MKCVRFSRFVAAFSVFAAMLAAVAVAQDAKPNAAIMPAPRPDAWWMQRHESMNARVKQGHVDLLFIGDSITHGWEGDGKDVWSKFYGKRNAVNLGIGGDQTQHVLWRLDHGNIDGISPKLAVLMIGTNNAGGNTPEEIAAGVTAIVERLRTKLPQTKVLVLAIFPRGPNNEDHLRQVNTKTNAIIEKLADGKDVFYLDIDPKFLAADGTLSTDIMPDLLHPNAKGYKIWAEAIEPMVKKLMGEEGNTKE
jgi:beta-glucosidase